MDDGAGGLVDCGVGTIVWVRRRNGSWWPGKILGSEELSASHLMSPRSGTPVKLLGREDASVDWYNLEKSKRVKPFRCGEFDDCIHRAEASQGMPPKKREKYARREDAILHALDLEKQLLHKNKNPIQDTNTNPPLYLYQHHHHHNVDDKTHPRFPVPFNYKHSSSNGKHHLADDDYDYDDDDEDDDDDDEDDDDGVTLDTMIHVGMLEKRKRTQDGNMDELGSKRRDRRRPLVHLLNTSPKLPLQLHEGGEDQQKQVAPMLHNSFHYPKFDVALSEDNNTTGSNEDTETDSSGTESLLSDTYDALSDEGEDIEFIPKTFGRSIAHEEVESMSEDESGVGDESGDSLPSSVAVSKWQLKGKRNSRRYPERNMHWNSFKEGEESSYFDKNNMRSQTAMVGQDIINWELEQQQPPSTSLQGGVGYWVVDPSPSAMYGGSSRQFGGRIKSMLIEVEVQVQSGYQREHVPMISLMSKLNDNAIVGHPIPIETLEDGSSDNIILSAADDDESLLLLGDGGGDSTIQPWTTARRTAKCRVPRPPHLSTLEEEEEEEEEEEASFDEYVVEETNRKGRKLMKKPQKKTSSLSCNQKIRTLSSIGGSGIQQQQQQNMDLKSQCYKGGEMKPESLPTAVACIPVKLVFSRLHEELVARHQ